MNAMQSDERTGRRSRLIEAAGLVAIAVAFSFANGLAYGVSNHQQYLLHGLHAMDSDFAAGDWFTCATQPHHSAFIPLMMLFATIGPLPLMFALANVAAASVVIFCLHGLARRWYKWPLVATCMTAFLLVLVPRPYIGMTSLIGLIFQPSTIGTVGLFAGFTLLSLGRVRNAGIVLGLAGIFHINLMVWAVLIAGAVIVLNYGQLKARGVLWLMTPLAIAVLYHTPFIAASRTEEQLAAARAAQWILHDLYMPYHSRPHTWGVAPFVHFASIMLVGGIAIAIAPPRGVSRIAKSIAGVVTAIVVGGMLLTMIWQVDLVALLFPYRLAPYLIAVAFLVTSGAMVRAMLSEDVSPRGCAVLLTATGSMLYGVGVENYGLVTWGTCVAIAMAGRIATAARSRLPALALIQIATIATLVAFDMGRIQLALALTATATAFAFQVNSRLRWRDSAMLSGLRMPAFATFCVLLAIGFVWRVGTHRKDRLGPEPAAEDAALYAWCRATPVGTQFVVPPDLAGFRLHAGRGIVIDWKCMPILPADTLEWYERLADVAGIRFTSLEQCLAGYRAMDTMRALTLAEDYRADYLVTRSDEHVGSLEGLPAAYASPTWRVYRITAASSAPVAFDSEVADAPHHCMPETRTASATDGVRNR